MRGTFFWLIGFVAISIVAAQNVQSNVKNQIEGGKVYMSIQGEIDLPDGTNLNIRLVFENRILVNNCLNLKDGKFFYQRGPLKVHYPQGDYTWEILKDSQVIHTKAFYLGIPRQERRETEEDIEFYRSVIAEAANLLNTIRPQAELFLKNRPQTKPEEVARWLNDMNQKMKNIAPMEAKLEEREHDFYVSRFPENDKDVDEIFASLRTLWNARIEQLCKLYEIPLPRRHKKILEKNPKFDFSACEKKIEGISKQILSRLPLPENFGETELEKDILWFNRIFMESSNEYRLAQDSFDPAKWREKYAEWQQELQDFRSKTAGYRKSPLILQYPTLVSDMEALSQSGRDLLASYIAALYRKAGIPEIPPEAAQVKSLPEITANIQKRFMKLHEIVAAKKNRENEEKQRVWEEMKSSLPLVKELEKSLEEWAQWKDIGAFNEWQQKWQPQLEKLREKMPVFISHFPKTGHSLFHTVESINMRCQLHSKILQGQIKPGSPEPSMMVRQAQLIFRSILKRLEEQLAEAGENQR